MLRAKKRQHRVRKMTLHEVGGPEFPVLEQLAKRLPAAWIRVPAEQFPRGGRCARARIKQRNVDLATGKRAVNERQVANYSGKKTNPKPASKTTRRRAKLVRGTTSPSPS